jgi:hypothetical protein
MFVGDEFPDWAGATHGRRKTRVVSKLTLGYNLIFGSVSPQVPFGFARIRPTGRLHENESAARYNLLLTICGPAGRERCMFVPSASEIHHNCLRAGVDVQFLVDAADVTANGVHGNAEVLGNLLVAMALN